MNQAQRNELILKFIKKEASNEELDGLRQWLLSDEANIQVFREEYEAFQLIHFGYKKNAVNPDLALKKIVKRLSSETEKPLEKRTFGLSKLALWRVAASVAIIISLTLAGIQYFDFPKRVQSADHIEFHSPPGEKSRIILADETTVWLNSGSTLNYSTQSSRNVKLIGEAFFDVVKDPQHPFLVETSSGLIIKVLGTRFNVLAYPDENHVETTLEEGKVEVDHKLLQQPVLLIAGEQLVFDNIESKAVIRKVDPHLFTIWKENIMRFEDTPFEDVVKKIERWYGIEVILDPELKNTERFTMSIKTESIRELLQMLQLTVNMNYKIEGGKVYIMKKK